MPDGDISELARNGKTQDVLAAFRRDVYRAIRRSHLTRVEQAVCEAMCGSWWSHNRSTSAARGLGASMVPIHPGIAKLSKRARCSERAAQYAMRLLEKMGVAVPVGYAKGGRHATRYMVSFNQIFYLSERGADALQKARADIGQGCKIAPVEGCKKGAKIAPGNKILGIENTAKGLRVIQGGALDGDGGAHD